VGIAHHQTVSAELVDTGTVSFGRCMHPFGIHSYKLMQYPRKNPTFSDEGGQNEKK